MATKSGDFSKFNTDNLRAGSRFRTGKALPKSRGVGWEGAKHALGTYKRPLEYKNLTKKDIEIGSKVIEDKLRSKKASYSGLNRKDILDIRYKLDKLRRQGKLSKADVKDFKAIAAKLKK